MSDYKDWTSVKDLWIEQNLRELAHGQTLAPIGRRVVMVQNLDGTQVIDPRFCYTGPKLTTSQANAILAMQEQQEEIAASYRAQ